MYAVRNSVVVDDLRFALDVLQESSHLGLDSEYASRLRSVILEQVERRESESGLNPHQFDPAPVVR